MAKYTLKDIESLAKTMKRNKEDDTPFSLLTGAGCSVTAGIPLARDLVDEIHKKYGDFIDRNLTEEKRNNYGEAMGCLSKGERKKLLDPYLSAAKINWAHIAIATMMNAGYVTHVLTFNFDSVLARACGLLGLYPATYDFAAAHSAETSYIATPAIVHLHGQGSGMVMLNSDEDTRIHADNLRPLLRRMLNESPLLVIGYSGDADAVFPVIGSEFIGQQRLYWAMYEETINPAINKLIRKGGRTSETICGANADRFLCDLARALGCFPPKLFTDPYGHLLDELEAVCEYPLEPDKQQDYLRGLRERLSAAQSEQTAAREGKPDIEELMMREDWDGVIQHAGSINSEEANLLAWAYFRQGDSFERKVISESVNKAEDLLRQARDKYELAIKVKPNFAEALNNLGNVLSEQAKRAIGEPADSLWQQAEEKYAQAIQIKPDSFEAFNNWGVTLRDQAKRATGKAAETLWKQAKEKYAQAIKINPKYHESYSNLSAALIDQSRIAENITVRNQLLEEATNQCKCCNMLKNGAGSYNLACIESLLGNYTESLGWLELCRATNHLYEEHMMKDSDLESLRATREFGKWKEKYFPDL